MRRNISNQPRIVAFLITATSSRVGTDAKPLTRTAVRSALSGGHDYFERRLTEIMLLAGLERDRAERLAAAAFILEVQGDEGVAPGSSSVAEIASTWMPRIEADAWGQGISIRLPKAVLVSPEAAPAEGVTLHPEDGAWFDISLIEAGSLGYLDQICLAVGLLPARDDLPEPLLHALATALARDPTDSEVDEALAVWKVLIEAHPVVLLRHLIDPSAFELASCAGADFFGPEEYEWLRDVPDNAALRAFAARYPLLVGMAVRSQDVVELLKGDPDAAVAAAEAAILEDGFDMEHELSGPSIGALTEDHLAALVGLRLETRLSVEEISRALDILCRLPASLLPDDCAGLAAWNRAVDAIVCASHDIWAATSESGLPDDPDFTEILIDALARALSDRQPGGGGAG